MLSQTRSCRYVCAPFRYITIARDLPLEKTSDSDIDSVLKRTILESSSMLDANRITSLKGKLAYRMDFTAFKPDEEIPTVDSRLRAVSESASTAIREKSEVELPAIVVQTSRAHCVKRDNFTLVEDEREEVSNKRFTHTFCLVL